MVAPFHDVVDDFGAAAGRAAAVVAPPFILEMILVVAVLCGDDAGNDVDADVAVGRIVLTPVAVLALIVPLLERWYPVVGVDLLIDFLGEGAHEEEAVCPVVADTE